MPQIALDNLNSLSGLASAASHAAVPSAGAASGFEDHLQRASQEGNGTANSRADSPAANRSPGANSTSNDTNHKTTAGSNPNSASKSSHTTASQGPTEPTKDGASKTGNQTEPSAGDKSHDAKDRHGDAQGPSTAPTIQLAAGATASDSPSKVGPLAEAIAQSATGSQAAPSSATENAKPAPINAAAAANPLGTGADTGQPTGGAIPVRQAAAESAPAGANGTAKAADAPLAPATTAAAKTIASEGQSEVQQPRQTPQTNVGDGKPTLAAAEASAAADAAPSGSGSPTDLNVRSASAGNSSSAPTDPPNPPHPGRETNPTQHLTAAASAIDALAATATPTAISSPVDSQSSESSSSGSPRKVSAAPAVDHVDAKSSTPPAGSTSANTSIESNGTSGIQPSSQTAAGSGTSEVDRVRFLQRVSSAFQAADERGGQIRLRLSPPELGSMKLELTVRDGVMTAHVQTETDTARNMLLEHLPQLRDRLADHNIKIDQFDVELMNQSRSGTPQNFSGNGNQGYQEPQDRSRRSQPTGAAVGAATLPAANVRTVNRQLDITV